MSESRVHAFGIRHHGPGSARSLAAALESLAPDIVLVEGPSDADPDVVALAAREDFVPPVALLSYVPTEPGRAIYYPFAIFSPELIALRYAFDHGVPVKFIDLPVSHVIALEIDAEQARAATPPEDSAEQGSSPPENPTLAFRRDPLDLVAEAAGYADGERWWEHVVEERRDLTGVFDAVLEVMTALRDELGDEALERESTQHEARREAWMRQAIRRATRDGHERIAVVCGAWHAPALLADVPVKADTEILKGLPKVKTRSTWIPWTPARLSRDSGYGAGVTSPGWYAHIWQHGATADAALTWLARVARVLREEGIDASPAQTIDAVRLAQTLAALRDRAVPGLPELTESTVASLLNGDATALALIRKRLVVGETLGSVPDGTPMVPLQESLTADQKRLRLPPHATEKLLELDLRQTIDLERSVLLHRLALLGVQWGKAERASSKGTFKEAWRLVWRPELAVAVIEAAVWGNTVGSASTAKATHLAQTAPDLPSVAMLLGQLLVADVPDATRVAIDRIDALAAVSSDFAQLCSALPPIARTLRYGDVRGTDQTLLAHVVTGMVARIAAGLPAACASLDDDAAGTMYAHVVGAHDALTRLRDSSLLDPWREALVRVLSLSGVHGLVAGRAARILLESEIISAEDAANRLGAALSAGSEPGAGAAWVDGFLRDSGTLLVHDAALWSIVDNWLSTLAADAFTVVLPLVRRTFSTFSAPERRRLGERARSSAGSVARVAHVEDAMPFDAERAAATLPMLAAYLGVEIV